MIFKTEYRRLEFFIRAYNMKHLLENCRILVINFLAYATPINGHALSKCHHIHGRWRLKFNRRHAHSEKITFFSWGDDTRFSLNDSHVNLKITIHPRIRFYITYDIRSTLLLFKIASETR